MRIGKIGADAAPARSGKVFRFGRRQVGQGDGAAAGRCLDRRVRIERLQGGQQARDVGRLRRIDLGDDEARRRLDLTAAERLAAQFGEAVQRVDRDDDLGDDDVMDEDGIGADRLDDGRRVGEAAGLEHDAVEAIGRSAVAAAFVAELPERGDEPVSAGAAAAAAGEHDEPFGGREGRRRRASPPPR